MALVDDLLGVIPERPELDPRGLAAAAHKPRVRNLALETLARVRERIPRSEGELRMALRELRALHSRERKLVQEGLRGLARLEAMLDAVLAPPVDPAARDLARWLGWLVYCGLPAREAGEVWRAHGPGPSPDFTAARKLEKLLPELLAPLTPAQQVSVMGNVDVGTAEELLQAFPDDIADFFRSSNGPAPVTLRANRLRTDREQLAKALQSQGVPTHPGRWCEDALHADVRRDFSQIPAWKKGWFEVQDEGSQLLAEVTAPDRGPVVDFCAGAGGKTLALSAHMDGKGQILSLDVRERGIKELRSRARRARVHNLQAVAMAPSGPLPWQATELEGQATRVLVDAPCSGSGVLRRHPEYRWRLGRVEHYPELQLRILDRAAPLVAVGGRLIYATCSVLPPEDEAVARHFLDQHPDFAPMPMADVLGADRAEALGAQAHLRLSPQRHGTDGFFATVFVRTR